MPFIGIFFLVLAVAVPYTPVIIDFTQTPELVQTTVQFLFASMFSICMFLTGWRFYESS